MALPNSNSIPTLLTDAKIYSEGKGLLGTANVEMPELKFLTDELSGLGIAGKMDIPVAGHFDSLTLKISWYTIEETAVAILQSRGHQFEIFASVQLYDAGTGTYEHRPLKVVTKTLTKAMKLGKFEPSKKMEGETEHEVTYLKMWHDGNEVLEIDKFNYIFRINGQDDLAKVRENLGMDY